MLVLSRKLGERIKIGPNIWITLVDIQRGKVRFGIEAPHEIPVHREELLPPSMQYNPPPPLTPRPADKIIDHGDGSVTKVYLPGAKGGV